MERGLRRLARLYGVQPEYFDIEGRLRRSPEGAVLDALRALGAPVEGPGDVADALSARGLELRRRGLPRVLVAWDGRLPPLELRRPVTRDGEPRFLLRLEGGEERVWAAGEPRLEPRPEETVAGERFRVERVTLPGRLPPGYHRLMAGDGPAGAAALVISAPLWAHDPGPERPWGAFLPLYALRTARDWGCGDLTDLRRLCEWTAERGGRYVGTLPLLATFLDSPYEPSPYSPVSRLFWSEVFVDPTAAPELDGCGAAQTLLASRELRRRLAALRAADEVDYRAQHREKRAVLGLLAACHFGQDGRGSAELRAFLEAVPEAERYARFRAVADRRREPWPRWPAGLRDGEPGPGDYDEADFRRHLYTQFLLNRQLDDVAAAAAERGVRLYLDMPLGVHPDGYDTWAQRGLFAQGVSVGAPPDPFMAKGQDWGFPPLRPTALRREGYAYFIAVVRAHLRHAGALRLDHVMGLHRLFWVPRGREPTEGVYVGSHPAELYAVLTLESQRARAVIVGEDLGTVPAGVRRDMRRHGVRRMYVAQFELSPDDDDGALGAVPDGAFASLNTHDMAMFAAFWNGDDIAQRRELGWLDDDEAAEARRSRAEQRRALVAWLRRSGMAGGGERAEDVLPALLEVLGRSEAGLVLVNLEDLWSERRPQNVPGTGQERPNWRRRAAYSLDEWTRMDAVAAALERLRRGRENGGADEG